MVALQVGGQVAPRAGRAELADVVGGTGQGDVGTLTGADRLGGLVVVLPRPDDDLDLGELCLEPVDRLLDRVGFPVAEEVPELDRAGGDAAGRRDRLPGWPRHAPGREGGRDEQTGGEGGATP